MEPTARNTAQDFINAFDSIPEQPLQRRRICIGGWWSELSYKSQELIKEVVDIQGWTCFQWNSVAHTDSQFLMCSDGDALYIVFRGTESRRDMLIDARFWGHTFPIPFRRRKRIHKGFYVAFESLRAIVDDYLKKYEGPTPPIMICGHSLGGALAVLCAHHLRREELNNMYSVRLITFGQPPVGDRSFRREAELLFDDGHYERIVMPSDIIPDLGFLVQHFGICYELHQDGSLRMVERRTGFPARTKHLLRHLLHHVHASAEYNNRLQQNPDEAPVE